VPLSSWGVIVEEDWDTLTAASILYQRLLLVLLILGLVVPAVVVTVGIKRITRPVHELISAAQAVAGGDLSNRITPRGSDETEVLADQFNRMAAQLYESYATLEQRVADRTRELAALNAIAAVASQTLDISEVLRAALDKTLEITGMTVGAAYRLNLENQTLHLIAQRGLSEEFIEFTTHFPRSESAAGHVTETLHPVVVQVADYPEGTLKRILIQAGVRLALSIPLVAKRQVLGFINLGAQDVRVFSDNELSLMASIGQQVGVAVENARLYEHAEETAAAAERSRLARELHDAVSQTLFSASMIAAVLPRLWERDPATAREQLAQLHQLTKGAQAEMRILLLELRPDALVETSLPDLLSQLGQATSSRAMVPVEVDVANTCELPIEVKVTLYRIAQEALNNVVKHADANRVILSLSCDVGTISLTVSDDGCGFDPDHVPRERLGQRSMQERADAIGAHFSVESAPGRGTTVACTWQTVSTPN
jgi:nitrate/nitrite-specific signal transduction histidine kinase